MLAGEVMTPNPTTVTPDTTISDVWELMRELEIRHVPVVEGGALVGVVSDRDLAYLDMARALSVQGADALRQELAAPIIKIMSTDVISVDPETDLGDIIALLLEHKVGALPVVQPDTREVVGIVSYIDVLRSLQDLLEEVD
jgi:acetoin utilization protein AcuB